MSTFKDLRQQSGMNLKQFSNYFEIPYSTIQNWEGGHRQCPEYLLKLMQYKLENENQAEWIQTSALCNPYCSACKHYNDRQSSYCPTCGKKMGIKKEGNQA